MLHRSILKVTKFQLPPPKCLSTVVKNILDGHHERLKQQEALWATMTHATLEDCAGLQKVMVSFDVL